MAETTSQPVEPQQPVMVAPGQHMAYQSPLGQQPIQCGHVPTPVPTGQQPAPHNLPAPANKPQKPSIQLTLDFAFLKTQAGLLKLLELVAIIFALSCVMHYKEIENRGGMLGSIRLKDNSDLDFFVGSLVSACVMVILVSFSCIIGLPTICGSLQYFHITVTLFHALWALLMVISSGLMASLAADWTKLMDASGVTFKTIDKELRIQLILLFVAVVFGFFSFISLVLNALLHIRFYFALRNQAHPGFQQPAMQTHPGFQQPAMQTHPGFQQPAMQTHPGFQQPAMQIHPGVQQPVIQAHPGVQQPMMQAHPEVQQS